MSQVVKSSFVVKMSKFGKRKDGETRRCFIIPTEKTAEAVKNYEGKQVKITIEEV